MFKYRVGLPFWRSLARMGITLSVMIEVLHDNEANVFVVTSPNLHGLIVEASDIKALLHEIHSSIDELLYEELSHQVNVNIKIAGVAYV
ncbi:hypothetical protein V757_10995 [Pelistega indica]|uniref:DUF1902 domain-containing protein n=1 Tax=Pelistega indica TaxID=1414851 RepID=V8FV18_9BURK|nr:hypothetical protein V757_10995 [Pelistega indica]